MTSLKEQAMFPRAQLFEAHSFGFPSFSVPSQAVHTLSLLTFPQWQDPGVQTKAALHSHPQLSCLWHDRCMLCVLLLATDQGNPTVSP